MTLSTQPVKGARDFYPEDMRTQKYIFKVWRDVCERFGYEEYDAPILESTELFLSKGNEEIIAEQTYSFTDRGGRNLTLRTEMTPSVSRMVASRRQELGYPLRLYSIPQCWRYERMQRGRGREFYQLNVDIFGSQGLDADVETIQLADNIMKKFGAKSGTFQIKVNSRKLLDGFLKETIGLEVTQVQSLTRLIDKMRKMDRAEFVGLVDGILSEQQRTDGKNDQLLQFLEVKNLKETQAIIGEHRSITDLGKLLEQLDSSGVAGVVFDPSLVRGFDYYTDIAFEVFDTNPENNRSMFGGGRYEGLVGLFGVEPVSAVGFGMGDITLRNFLESNKLVPNLKPASDVYVIIIGDVSDKANKPVNELREMGLNVAVGMGRSVDKEIKTAQKLGIQHVLFIGELELSSESYTLKNLTTSNEEKHSLQRIVSIVKDYRK